VAATSRAVVRVAAPSRRSLRRLACAACVVATALTGACREAPSDDAAAGSASTQHVIRLDHAAFAKAVRDDAAASAAGTAEPWQPRLLPDLWRSHGEGESGYGWYRVQFALPARPQTRWAIHLAFAHSSFDVRVNGTTIAAAPDFDAFALEPHPSQPHLIDVPSGALVAGTNRIDVRLRVEQDIDGGLSAVEIGPRALVGRRYLEERFWRADLPRALDFTLLVAAAFMLLLWLRRPRETIYPWFAALAVVWAVRGFYVAGGGSWLRLLHGTIGHASQDVFLGATLLLGCALLLIVVDRFAGRPQPLLEFPALAFGVLAMAFQGALGRLVSELLDPVWHVVAAVLAALAVRTVAMMTWRKPDPGNLLIALGVAFMLAMALHDVLVANHVIAYSATHWLAFGPPVLLATVVVALGGRYFHAFDEAERLNRELERRVAERARDIERQYERISALERQQAVADERERLMRDMHDGVGSELMTTLNAFERGRLTTEQVGELLRGCIDDLRLVIDSLDVGEAGLATALANLRYRLEPRLAAAGMQLDWRVDPQAGAWLAPGGVLHILRVVQEALTNALKHARATRLAVRVTEAEGALDVEISDDGSGIAPDRRSVDGRGLANMRQRAQSLGGELETIALSPGTRVQLRLPTLPRLREPAALPR